MTHGSLTDYTLPAPAPADDDGAPRAVALIGSTGSIGTQGLDVIAQDPARLRAVALAGGANTTLLAEQAVAAVDALDGVRLTGPRDLDPATGEPLPPGTRRLPGNVHITVPGRTADALLFSFDMAGLDTSSGSACTAGVAEPSHVVAALPGRTEADARATQRFTLGRTTTPAEAAALIDALRTLLGPGV